MAITHKKVDQTPDDASLLPAENYVYPSDWNDDHEVTVEVPTIDHTSIGQKINTLNAGETVTVMDMVTLDATSQWVKTDANAAALYAGPLGISLESKTTGQVMTVALPGSVIRNDSWAWNPGAVLYMSETAGSITETAPTTSDSATRVIGFSITATAIFFNPSANYMVHV